MCGIVGYVGYRSVPELLLEGLHRLEYRGYDSAGLGVHENGFISIRKKVGRVMELERLVGEQPMHGRVGIGHTRWATHGGISDTNSHPAAESFPASSSVSTSLRAQPKVVMETVILLALIGTSLPI
mgnify:CR=1 FL=1